MRIPPSELERWDEDDIDMMLALADVEADICSGCGGYLSKTTKHDHGYRIHTKGCARCEALATFTKNQAKQDEAYENLPQSAIEDLAADGEPRWVRPEGRRLYIEPIPLPREPEAAEELTPEQA